MMSVPMFDERWRICLTFSVSSPCGSASWITRSATWSEPGTRISVFGVMSCCESAPPIVTTLNTEPGSKTSFTAWSTVRPRLVAAGSRSRCSPAPAPSRGSRPVCGSRTIAVAFFACHSLTVCSSTCSAFAWMWLSSVRKTSRPFARRALLDRVDGLAERVPHHRRRARRALQLRVQLELEPGEAGVVGARVAEHRRRDGSLRIDALLIRLEREARRGGASELAGEASAAPSARRRRSRGCGRRAAGTRGLTFSPSTFAAIRASRARVGDLHRVGVDVVACSPIASGVPSRS